MSDTESVLAIQDEETEETASVITCSEDITINWIVALNPDWSSINPNSSSNMENSDGE